MKGHRYIDPEQELYINARQELIDMGVYIEDD